VKQDRKAKKADDMSERNESKRRILAYLETHGRCTTAQVGKGIGMNSNGIHNIMRRLEAAGLIEIAGDDEAWRGGGFPPKLWRATGAQAPKREHKPGPSLVQRAVASQPALATVWMHKEAA
jgi:predicted ArsR family transcriptional regulator